MQAIRTRNFLQARQTNTDKNLQNLHNISISNIFSQVACPDFARAGGKTFLGPTSILLLLYRLFHFLGLFLSLGCHFN